MHCPSKMEGEWLVTSLKNASTQKKMSAGGIEAYTSQSIVSTNKTLYIVIYTFISMFYSAIDVDVLSNYRPVSNLPQLSKVFEKVIAKRIQEHTFAMSELYQSAYKSCQSTETALVCECVDIQLAFDKTMGTVLIMIDLSAAFGTINHDILLRRLHDRYGIMGDVLKWVKSNYDLFM